jgi:phospholipid/cholesterol/gamma-HCH transport system substrate-binding protein
MGQFRRWLAPVVIAVLVGVVGFAVWRREAPTRGLVAHFSRAVGIFAGSDVRVLGVRIGSVVSVTPQGQTVRVEMRYEAGYAIPAGAQAVVVPPSIVSDRYIQLTPAYTSGAILPDGADLPSDRTVVPLELDDVYTTLDDLNRALGPNGANADGALSDLVETARKNLDGNGQQLHDTLAGLSDALSTVSDERDDLFGTVDNLQQFTTTLATSDSQVRELNQRLADVGEQLAAERDELAAALHTLATALADITTFVRDNREALSANVTALADISGVLVRQQKALIDVLDVAPLALSNLNLAFNPRSGTLDTRDNAMGPYDPASYVCSLLVNAVPAGQVPQACLDLAKTLQQRGLQLPDELRRLLGQPAAASPKATAPAKTTPDTTADPTLGGILRGGS